MAANVVKLAQLRRRSGIDRPFGAGVDDVTIEPQNRSVRVRYIVDGEVREHIKLPTLALEPIVARLKRLAQMELQTGAAADVGPGGRIRLRVDEHFYDLRVTTHATPWGEGVELRFQA